MSRKLVTSSAAWLSVFWIVCWINRQAHPDSLGPYRLLAWRGLAASLHHQLSCLLDRHGLVDKPLLEYLG